MAGGGGGRSLEDTPTWAVAVVCFVLVLISIFIEQIIHFIGKWFLSKHKRGLYEALEKIKSELMLLGFISLLLSVLQTPISKICISEKAGNSWHPCSLSKTTTDSESEEHRRRLLSFSAGGFRRFLASSSTDKCAEKGKVPFVSSDAIHQLHIFIFVLAVFHVLQCITTMALGRLKMRSWKRWENETKTIEYQFSHDPERFRFARDTSFGRRHLNCWSAQPVLVWIFCFFRQFFRSVTKVDYLTLRHGFIMAHLAPHSHHSFDFQKYINRSLEDDFAVVVGISPPIWFFAVLFLLFNTDGWYSYLWLPFIPVIILLLVGTELQVIITKMGLKIQDRGEVVKGVPVVEPGDDLFWFNSPRLVIYLIQFVLFQNAFQLAFLIYTLLQFGTSSCFHYHTAGYIIKTTTGVLIQILCSYVTLPLYALVTQMGSTMKPTIFNNKVATALKDWHHTAKKHIKHNKGSVTASATPMSSRPGTPSRGNSPVHLLRNYHGQFSDDLPTSPSYHNVLAPSPDDWELKDSPPTNNQLGDGSSTSHHQQQTQKLVHRGSLIDHVDDEYERDDESGEPAPPRSTSTAQHEIDMGSVEFSFARRSRK